jgi:hypothetical protein
VAGLVAFLAQGDEVPGVVFPGQHMFLFFSGKMVLPVVYLEFMPAAAIPAAVIVSFQNGFPFYQPVPVSEQFAVNLCFFKCAVHHFVLLFVSRQI